MNKHAFHYDIHKDDGTVCSMCHECGDPLDSPQHFIYVCLDGCGMFNCPTFKKWFRLYCAACGRKATKVSGKIAHTIRQTPGALAKTPQLEIQPSDKFSTTLERRAAKLPPYDPRRPTDKHEFTLAPGNQLAQHSFCQCGQNASRNVHIADAPQIPYPDFSRAHRESKFNFNQQSCGACTAGDHKNCGLHPSCYCFRINPQAHPTQRR